MIWGHEPVFLFNVALTALVAGFFWSAGCWLLGRLAR